MILLVSFFEIGVPIAVVVQPVSFVEYPSLSPQFVLNPVLEFLSSSFRFLVELLPIRIVLFRCPLLMLRMMFVTYCQVLIAIGLFILVLSQLYQYFVEVV